MSSKLLLFDEFARDDLSPSGYSEAHFGFLNRSGRKFFAFIRQTLQQWFDEYEAKPEKREDLLRDFRAEGVNRHLGAFFELYLHQLFTRLGFSVEVEPEWDVRNPDFMLTAPSGERMLFEATSTFPGTQFGSSRTLENTILDEINRRVNSPNFFLHVVIKGSPVGNPPYSRLCAQVQKELDELDPDEVTQSLLQEGETIPREYPIIPWKDENWSIEIQAVPKKPEARGKTARTIGSQSPPVQLVNTAAHIRRSLEAKCSRYGNDLPIPYLLAIDVHDHWCDEEEVLQALFGQEVWSYTQQSGGEISRSVGREPDGTWYGPNGFQKTRMSGLLVFRQLTPSQIGFVSPVLWHHPAAQNPIKSETIPLSQQVPDPALNRYVFQEGVSAPETLGINQDMMWQINDADRLEWRQSGREPE